MTKWLTCTKKTGFKMIMVSTGLSRYLEYFKFIFFFKKCVNDSWVNLSEMAEVNCEEDTYQNCNPHRQYIETLHVNAHESRGDNCNGADSLKKEEIVSESEVDFKQRFMYRKSTCRLFQLKGNSLEKLVKTTDNRLFNIDHRLKSKGVN